MKILVCVFICGILVSFPTFAQPTAGLTAAPKISSNTASVSCKVLEEFKSKLHAAISAALKYPVKVLYHGVWGITTVEYDYFDGRATHIRVTNSSGDGVLDRAAIAAVKNADYAAIHPTIHNIQIHDVVFIIFDNTGVLSRNTPNPNSKHARNHAETACVAG